MCQARNEDNDDALLEKALDLQTSTAAAAAAAAAQSLKAEAIRQQDAMRM